MKTQKKREEERRIKKRKRKRSIFFIFFKFPPTGFAGFINIIYLIIKNEIYIKSNYKIIKNIYIFSKKNNKFIYFLIVKYLGISIYIGSAVWGGPNINL